MTSLEVKYFSKFICKLKILDRDKIDKMIEIDLLLNKMFHFTEEKGIEKKLMVNHDILNPAQCTLYLHVIYMYMLNSKSYKI